MDPEKRTIVSRVTAASPSPDLDLHRLPSSSGNRSNTFETSARNNPNHELFCRMIGMPSNFDRQEFPSIWNIFAQKHKKIYKGLYPRVRGAYQWHTFQYWAVATMSNSLLWMQICFGAALTALGGTKSDHASIAIIVLGALQTVFGGFITYFKSRNQPNRARQARKSVKKVLDAIENAEGMLRDPTFEPPPYQPALSGAGVGGGGQQDSWLSGAVHVEIHGVHGLVWRFMDMYMDAVREQEANYPDFWLSNKRSTDSGEAAMLRDMLKDLKKQGLVTTTTITDPNAPLPPSNSAAQASGAATAMTSHGIMPASPNLAAHTVTPGGAPIPAPSAANPSIPMNSSAGVSTSGHQVFVGREAAV